MSTLTANAKPAKPSDFTVFAYQVFSASATLMDFQTYLDTYMEILQLLYWNPDIDLPLAVSLGTQQPTKLDA